MPNGTDNWGVCIDERATTYSFMGDIEESGRFCSLPFKMGDWIYEKCTRSTPSNKTDYYWCPSKEQADADKDFNGTTHGLCNDFAQPPDNSCPDHYFPVSEWAEARP